VPFIHEVDGRMQMVLSGDKSVASYNPDTGKLLWIIDGPTEQFVASVVFNPGADLFFATGGFPEFHMVALQGDGNANVTATKIKWRANKGASYVPSPVSVGDCFFIVSDAGIASCFDAASGKNQWQERLGGDHHASAVTANDLVYFLSDRGVMTVTKAAREFGVVAKNQLEGQFFASPAFSDGQIFLRGDSYLYCLQNQ
jgi:outer membrane protein assembly factor BamB